MTTETAKRARCPGCKTELAITVSAGYSGGRSDVPDPQVVKMDFQDHCEGDRDCPIVGLPAAVMGVRLMSDEMRPIEEWHTVRSVCDGCGHNTELDILDDERAFCHVCGTTNHLHIIELDDESRVAVMQRRWDETGAPPY